MSSFAAIDLSQLPAPQIVEQIDFELILAERKAYMISLWPFEEQAQIAARLELESEPLTKLLQENAYRETIWRQRVNEASIANLLALAKGPDLDQLAGNFNVQRLVVQEAKPMAVPPVARIMESDDSLRERAQMSWEGLSTAGPRNSYIFHARGADGRVADATAESPSPAVAVVTVLSLLGDGTAPPDLIAAVKIYLSDDNRRPVGDRLTVQAAQILRYPVIAKLYLLTSGPESEPILAAAEARLWAYVGQRRRLGMEVSESAVHAALFVEGVRKVVLENWVDIVATEAQAPYCTDVNITRGAD
ncbi:Phage-related baseplate assembly protein [Pseudomonas antarctica]|uniref:Baseplate J-like protein n=1 Tax=Pseudomonas antarctica TaxID=219572 RepID=A0A1G9YD66_9PSED|nr:baseplate J/gp47 family protein [Pseudomonas antarctica]KAF2410509.1 baseplate J-like protein [Pseudomonas antarctica]SDN07108.1 Phage-related baseplate assembly protein [Pseudomonas antarctica]